MQTETNNQITKTTGKVSRPVRNLLHRLSEPTVIYTGSKKFNSKASKAQIRNFCREAVALINNECTVTLNIDESGVHLNINNNQINLSLIYHEKGGTNEQKQSN